MSEPIITPAEPVTVRPGLISIGDFARDAFAEVEATKAASEIKPDKETKPTGTPEGEVAPSLEQSSTPAGGAGEHEAPEPTGKVGEQFKALKAKQKAELQALKDELAVLRNQSKQSARQAPEELTARMAQLEKERNELSETLKIASLERHPDFQKHYDLKTKAAIGAAERSLPADKVKLLSQIAKISDSDYRNVLMEKLFDGMTAGQQSMAAAAILKLDELDMERQGDLSAASEKLKLLQERQANEAKARAEATESEFHGLKKSWCQNMPAYQKREGDEEWNTAVDQRWEAAHNIITNWDNITTKDRAKLAGWAMAGETLVKGQMALMKENQELKATIEKIRGAAPNAGNGSTGHVETDPYANMDAAKALAKQVQDAGLFANR